MCPGGHIPYADEYGTDDTATETTYSTNSNSGSPSRSLCFRLIAAHRARHCQCQGPVSHSPGSHSCCGFRSDSGCCSVPASTDAAVAAAAAVAVGAAVAVVVVAAAVGNHHGNDDDGGAPHARSATQTATASVAVPVAAAARRCARASTPQAASRPGTRRRAPRNAPGAGRRPGTRRMSVSASADAQVRAGRRHGTRRTNASAHVSALGLCTSRGLAMAAVAPGSARGTLGDVRAGGVVVASAARRHSEAGPDERAIGGNMRVIAGMVAVAVLGSGMSRCAVGWRR